MKKAWIDVKDILECGDSGKELPAPVKVPVDFYPLSTLVNRGIVMGIESELVQRRDIGFSHFKFSTRVSTHSFLGRNDIFTDSQKKMEKK